MEPGIAYERASRAAPEPKPITEKEGRPGRASSSTYGAAGSLLVVLVWVYYSAQIFLYGAEFAKVYTRRYGSLRRVERAPAAPGPGMSGAPGPVASAATPTPAPRLDSRRTIGEARAHTDESDR